MDIAQLNVLVDTLREQRTHAAAVEAHANKLREEFENKNQVYFQLVANAREAVAETQQKVLEALRENDLKQWKTGKATVSRKTSTKYKIVDESLVIAELKKHNLTDYIKETLTDQVKALFNHLKLPGVEEINTEYVSVMEAKKKDETEQ